MEKEIMFIDRWDDYLKYFREENKDIYFTEEYVKLCADNKSKAECFVYKAGNNILLFPYIKREIELLKGEYFDFETSYGYGGPIANTNSLSFIHKAFDEFCCSAKKNRIIAGFIRFHPLLENHTLLADKCDVVFDRKTVAMNLNLEPDEIWNEQIHSKHRNSIRKAQKSGLSYLADENLQCLDVFVNIYRSTMNRLKAEGFYYFSNEYFNNIKKNLGRNVFLGLVLLQEKIISAALFFKYGIFGHYHLSGSLESYKQYNPNNFLVYNTALYMKKVGVRLFHLGGGNNSNPEDGLYQFKKRFSKYESSFYIGKLILDEQIYEDVCNTWTEKFSEKREKHKNLVLRYRY